MAEAVGILEVFGLATAFVAADAGCKAANVHLEVFDKNKPANADSLPEAGGFRFLLLGSNRIYRIQGHIGDVPSFIIISQIAHPGILRYRGIQKGFHLYLHRQLPQISVIRANGQGIPGAQGNGIRRAAHHADGQGIRRLHRLGYHMGKAVVVQLHVVIPVVLGMQRHTEQGYPVPFTEGHQASACCVRKAGFDAHHALIHGQQLVGVFQPPVVGRIAEAHLCPGLAANGTKVRVLHGCPCQQSHIPGGCPVSLRIQTGGGHKAGVGHADPGSPCIHQLCKFRDGASQPDGCGIGCIVAGGQQHAIAEHAFGDHVPLLESHGGALHPDGFRIHHEPVIQSAAFQAQQGGHDLGGAGDGTLFVPVFGQQHLAGVRLHQHISLGGNAQRVGSMHRRTAKMQAAQYRQHQTQPFFHQAPPDMFFCINIWETGFDYSAFGFLPFRLLIKPEIFSITSGTRLISALGVEASMDSCISLTSPFRITRNATG